MKSADIDRISKSIEEIIELEYQRAKKREGRLRKFPTRFYLYIGLSILIGIFSLIFFIAGKLTFSDLLILIFVAITCFLQALSFQHSRNTPPRKKKDFDTWLWKFEFTTLCYDIATSILILMTQITYYLGDGHLSE